MQPITTDEILVDAYVEDVRHLPAWAVQATPVCRPRYLVAHHLGGCRHATDTWQFQHVAFECVEDIPIGRIGQTAARCPHNQGLINIHTEGLSAHKLYLPVYDDRPGDQHDRRRKLSDDQAATQPLAAGSIFEGTFQDRHRLVTGE